MAVSKREVKRIFSNPLYIFAMIAAPIFSLIFFMTLMGKGQPDSLPVAMVDMDNSANSRNVVRTLDAFKNTEIVAHCNSFQEARDMMQRGKIYGIFYIPEDFSKDLQAQRQPTISYYCNYAYLTAASLVFQDFMTMSELVGGSATQSTLLAKGKSPQQVSAFLQPVVVERHLLSNPMVNYSLYLNNTIPIAILVIFVFLTTVYSMGDELKDGTARQWIGLADDSIYKAVTGKLLPQTVIFFVMALLFALVMFGIYDFPHKAGLLNEILLLWLLVLASQGFGIFLMGLIPHFRFAMSIACLWGILEVSMTGFTFPITSMQPALKALSVCFPLRHYFLIYVSQGLNGYPLFYSWDSVLWLLMFIVLPLTVLYRLKGVLLTYRYEP